jgi:hypothetical protein
MFLAKEGNMTENKSPAELLLEREKRVMDAVQLKVPDRVPIIPSFAYFPAKYARVTCEDVFLSSQVARGL